MLGLALVLGKKYKNSKASYIGGTASSLYVFKEDYYGLLSSIAYIFTALKCSITYALSEDCLRLLKGIDHIYSFLRLGPVTACSNSNKKSFSTL
jgi:hypothetical protein